jgi:hypothetical protein
VNCTLFYVVDVWPGTAIDKGTSANRGKGLIRPDVYSCFDHNVLSNVADIEKIFNVEVKLMFSI